MRLAFFITNIGIGGAERVLTNLANKFSLNGYDVFLITKYKCSDKVKEYTVEKSVHRVNIFSYEIKKKSVLKLLYQIKFVRDFCNENDIDVLISFMGINNIKGILATTGLKTKSIISVRADPKFEYENIVLRALAKVLYPLASGIVFQTNEEKEFFSKKIQNKSQIIMNPVSKRFYDINGDNNDGDIVVVGRLEKEKNIPLILKAFKKVIEVYPDEHLSIYGDGTQKEILIDLVKQYGIEQKVTFHGVVKNVEKHIKNAKMFILSSEHEGLPNCLLEAMAIGLPVISTDCPAGGPRDVIQDGKNGFLIPVNDENQLTEKMIYMLRSPDIRNKFSQSAKKMSQKFNEEVIFSQWEKYINECLMRK